MKKQFFRLAITGLILLIFADAYSRNLEGKKVLVLHSYHQGYEWTYEVSRGIHDVFNSHRGAEVYVTYMDFLRIPSEAYLDALENLYRIRYNGIKFDAVIVSDDPAFNFALSRRDRLFKDIPLVFCGVNNFNHDRIKGHKYITGVNESISIRETVDVALKFRSRARKMAVISGTGMTMDQNLEIFKKIAPLYEKDIEIVYLTELEPGELLKGLKNIGPEDIVINLGYLQSPSGKKFKPHEVFEFLKDSTKAAVFTCWDFAITYGAVGGMAVHGYTQGTMAAGMALRILNGESVRNIPVVMKSPNRFIFNDVLLHRYDIPDEKIPADSLFVNRLEKNLISNWDKTKSGVFFGYNLFENHGSIMLLVDPVSGIIVDANRSAFSFYGYPHLVGKSIFDINTLSESELKGAIKDALGLRRNSFVFQHRAFDGRVIDVKSYVYPVEINKHRYLFSIINDISDQLRAERNIEERNRLVLIVVISALMLLSIFTVFLVGNILKKRETEELLRKSEGKLETMLQTMMDGMVTVDTGGRINYSNSAAERILDIGKDILGKYYNSREWRQIDSEGKPFPAEKLPLHIALHEKRTAVNVEHMIESEDGQRKWLSVSAAPLFDNKGLFFGGIASFRDISENKKSEEQIRKLLMEKELLLKEVHHRIKNNMNTIKGLLALQLTAEKNPDSASSLRDAENRVQSMIMLYDRLYCSSNYRELSVRDYLQALTEEIVGSFPNRGIVNIETDIEDFILNIQMLSPLGIIVNELLTNIMKYAFVDRENGLIKVTASIKDSRVRVLIKDNGVGIPESVTFEKSTGFGLSLVDMLTQQIGGAIRVERGEGTVFILEFNV